MVYGHAWNGPFARVLRGSCKNRVRTSAHTVAADVVSRHSQVLRYVAALHDIPVFDSDDARGSAHDSCSYVLTCETMFLHGRTNTSRLPLRQLLVILPQSPSPLKKSSPFWPTSALISSLSNLTMATNTYG